MERGPLKTNVNPEITEKVATHLTTYKLRVLHGKISRKWAKDDTK